jgi:transposase
LASAVSHQYNMKRKKFRTYEPNQLMLLPPSIDEWLPQRHLARFIGEIIDMMDIGAIQSEYEKELRGYPPYHPRMLLKVLIYGYSVGIRTSRKLAKACVEDVAFRYLTANQLPDHRTICDFRMRHTEAFHGLFLKSVLLCEEAGLTGLGHIALDGTKIAANASKHKAMSYARIKAEEERLAKEIAEIIDQAQAADEQDDEKYGKDNDGNEMPEELEFRETRLKRIKEAKAALEKRAAERKPDRDDNKDDGKGDPPLPNDNDQYNFTDPESRIMPSSENKKNFTQAYNAQAAVNEHQIIVAAAVSNQSADRTQLPGMMAKVRANTGTLPDDLTADAGYFSEKNVLFLREELQIRALIPPDKQRHGKPLEAPKAEPGPNAPLSEQMRWLLATDIGRTTYALRKILVEPVFGQIKACMNFTRFLLRGEKKVSGEWQLACLCHNLRKLYRYRTAGA